MAERYIVVDAANLFFRCRYVGLGDAYTKAGLALQIVFRSIRKMWREFKGTHVVFCLEGGSWRVAEYSKYKAARKLKSLQMTEKEKEEEAIFYTAMDGMLTFLRDQTNVTILKAPGVEGDDWMARWTHLHPDDEHIIVTGDTDMYQLLAQNVKLFDGVRELLISTDCITNADGDKVSFHINSQGKLKVGKPINKKNENLDFKPEQEWWRRALFMKCMRGDSGDGIFSAYPKVREPKLIAAWNDREEQGFNWNNLMLQTWKHMEGHEVVVREAYEFNKKLIDLTQQPDPIKDLMDAAIVEAVQKERRKTVGIHFMRFCANHDLPNLSKECADHAEYLNAPYLK